MFGNIYKNKRVFISGHTGFKGSWLTLWLIKLGAKISGYSLPIKKNKTRLDNKTLKIISHFEGDIRDFKHLHKKIKLFKPEIIFHLAAQSLVKESYRNPIFTFETNTIGTINILKAINETNSIKAGVIITSDKVYKNINQKRGYKENDILEGKDPYSASKSCAEIAAKCFLDSYFKDKKKLIAVARAGNVIGGGDWSENRIVPDIIKSLKKKKEINY